MLVMGTSFWRHAVPDLLPEPLGDLSVQHAHAVCVAAGAQRQNGHREGLALVFAGLAEPHELLKIDPDFAWVVGEVTLHQIEGKSVVSRRHRCVGGKNVP
jgi:hypothetical protein